MNKNPERPKNMNEIMSSIADPNFKEPKTENEVYWENQKKILREVFD